MLSVFVIAPLQTVMAEVAMGKQGRKHLLLMKIVFLRAQFSDFGISKEE